MNPSFTTRGTGDFGNTLDETRVRDLHSTDWEECYQVTNNAAWSIGEPHERVLRGGDVR
jgi:hypothetical protein